MQTTYTLLENLPRNLIGQIAVLISHPYDSRNKQFEYRIQFVVREKRTQSGKWNYQIGEEARKSSEEFISRLIGKFEQEAKKHK